MKREDVHNATATQVNREILPVKMSVDRQLEEMQIEQTIPFSIKRIIFEVIPSGSVEIVSDNISLHRIADICQK